MLNNSLFLSDCSVVLTHPIFNSSKTGMGSVLEDLRHACTRLLLGGKTR